MYENQYFISNIKLDNSYGLNISTFNNLNVYSHPILNISTAKFKSIEILLLGYILDPLQPEVRDAEIRLNIGEMVGSKPGQRFRVIDKDVILEITSADKDTSLAKIVKGVALLQEGSRLEAIY